MSKPRDMARYLLRVSYDCHGKTIPLPKNSRRHPPKFPIFDKLRAKRRLQKRRELRRRVIVKYLMNEPGRFDALYNEWRSLPRSKKSGMSFARFVQRRFNGQGLHI